MKLSTICSCLLALALAACGGSIKWEMGTDANGMTDSLKLDMLAGSTTQATLKVVAEGTYAGEYNFTAASDEPVIAAATVNPTAGDVKDGVAFEVTVTITSSATAAVNGIGFVDVWAKAKEDAGNSAMTAIRVTIVQ